MIRNFKEYTPQIGDKVFVDASAVVIGRAIIGEDSSIWPLACVRGDVNQITIGKRTNIQDGTIVHVNHERPGVQKGSAIEIGNDVTIGHRVILHGCKIEDLSLVGMGSIIMDDAIIESHVLLAAGSLVAPGKRLESGYLYVGAPVKKIRELTDDEINFFAYSAKHYVSLKNQHL